MTADTSSCPLRARALSCRLGRTLAVDRVDLALEAGVTVALVGHNGSGKSTLLRALAGVLRPSAGRVEFADGRDPARSAEARLAIGYLPQRTPVIPELSVRGQLAFLARLRACAREAVAEALASWGLEAVADRHGGALSPGELRRLGMAQAALGDPPVLLLDEPHAGLDGAGRERLDCWLREVAGRTVVVHATHDPAAAVDLSDRIVVLQAGRLVHDAPARPAAGAYRIDLRGAPPVRLACGVLERLDDSGAWLARPHRSIGELVAELATGAVAIERLVPADEDAQAQLRRLMSEAPWN